MRSSEIPTMTEAEFEDALARAVAGFILTDQGADDDVADALDRVAVDPIAPNIAAARAAFRRMTSGDSGEPIPSRGIRPL